LTQARERKMPNDITEMLVRAERGEYGLPDVHNLIEEILYLRIALQAADDVWDSTFTEKRAQARQLVRRALGEA
jgi:hypothetical protein